MKDGVILELLIIQILVITLLIGIIIYIIYARHNIALERKFSKYTVSRLVNTEISIFDKLVLKLNILIKKVSSIINKSEVLRKYGISYEKHIPYDKIDDRKGIDYVSIKLLLGVLTIIFYIFTEMFQYSKITFAGVVLSFAIGFFITDIFVQIEYKKKRKEISEDLLKAIIIMNNSFKSGMSIMQAIEIVKNELTGALGDEFKKIYLDMSYGLTIEVVFDRFYNRVKLDDAKFITTSLTLLNKTGGNIVKVFKSIEREFFDKKKLNDELKTTTASSNFIYKVLLAVPFVVCLLIVTLNPSYFNPLFKTQLGILIVMVIFLLYIMYAYIIKRIMRVDF